MSHRAVCPFCERSRAVRKNGRLRAHGDPGTGSACLGSGRETESMYAAPTQPEPEPPVTCSGCVGQHGGKRVQPCGTAGCECYCNR